MTGLLENIYKLQNENTLTFLYRASKIVLGALNYTAVRKKYMDVFGLDMEEAEEMACELSLCLDKCSKVEAPLYVDEMSSILASQTEGEFVFHIFRSSGEEMEITDLNSTNGTSINGRLLQTNESCPLRSGDTIGIADTAYQFR